MAHQYDSLDRATTLSLSVELVQGRNQKSSAFKIFGAQNYLIQDGSWKEEFHYNIFDTMALGIAEPKP